MQLRDLITHVDRYGSDGVLHTAVELGFDFDDLVVLEMHCEKNDDAKKRYATKRRGTPQARAETKVKRLLGINDDEETTQ